MTKKKTMTADKELEQLLLGEDSLAQYHKMVEDLWNQAFKGKIDKNTLRAKQEFEDKVLEAFSNSTHDTITEIKPSQAGDFSPIEIKSTVTEDGIKIDTKVLEEDEASSLNDWEQLDAWEQWEQEETVSDIAEAAFERIRNNEIKVVAEEFKKGNLPNFEEALSSAMEVRSERTKEENEKWLKEINEKLAEDFKKIKEERIHSEKQREEIGRGARERLAEIKEFGIGLKAKAEEVKKEAMQLKMEARSQLKEVPIYKPSMPEYTTSGADLGHVIIESEKLPKFKDCRDAATKGTEAHTHMMKEGKRLTRLVYRDKQKLNEGKMFKYIITAVSVHCLAFCFWVGTLFFDIGQTREIIIYLLMAVYTFFYVMLSIKAYESIKIQRKLEEVDKKYGGY